MNLAIRILLVAQHTYLGVGRLTVEISRLHTQTYTDTHGRNPLDEGSVRRGDLYLPTRNIHIKTSIPQVGFEPTIPASERPQNYALDRAATLTEQLEITVENYEILC